MHLNPERFPKGAAVNETSQHALKIPVDIDWLQSKSSQKSRRLAGYDPVLCLTPSGDVVLSLGWTW